MKHLAALGGTPVRTAPYPPWPRAGEEERRNLLAALDSGNWDSRHGNFVRTFERRFAKFQGAAHGICVTNGEAALRLVLTALELPAGGEVVIPGYTFIASATAVLQAGLVPVFVDVDPRTYCLDAGAAEAAVGPGTVAVMPVHLGGLPADMDAVGRLAEAHGLAVVEDAAQGWGSRWRDRGVGALGDGGAFSFHASKNIAAGEGGLILTDDDELAARCRSLADCGRGTAGERYRHLVLGGNFRLSEFQGAVLCGQLDRYPEQQRRRDANSRALRRELQGIDGVRVQELPAAVTAHSWHLVVLRVDTEAFGGIGRDRLVDALVAEGIPAASGYALPAYAQPLFRDGSVPHRVEDCPVSERACAGEALWIRHDALLGDEDDALDVARALAKVQKYHRELQ